MDDDDLAGVELPLKKRGRPLLLGKELDQRSLLFLYAPLENKNLRGV